MRLVAALVLLLACDAGEKKAPSPAPVAPTALGSATRSGPRPLMRVGNAFSDCRAEFPGTHGTQVPARVLHPAGCSLVANPTEGGGESWVMFLLDASSPAELGYFIRCESLPQIDWVHDRVVVLGLEWPDADMTLNRVFDDGTTQTFVLEARGGEHAPTFKLTFALVPRERRSDFRVCHEP